MIAAGLAMASLGSLSKTEQDLSTLLRIFKDSQMAKSSNYGTGSSDSQDRTSKRKTRKVSDDHGFDSQSSKKRNSDSRRPRNDTNDDDIKQRERRLREKQDELDKLESRLKKQRRNIAKQMNDASSNSMSPKNIPAVDRDGRPSEITDLIATLKRLEKRLGASLQSSPTSSNGILPPPSTPEEARDQLRTLENEIKRKQKNKEKLDATINKLAEKLQQDLEIIRGHAQPKPTAPYQVPTQPYAYPQQQPGYQNYPQVQPQQQVQSPYQAQQSQAQYYQQPTQYQGYQQQAR